MKVKKIMLEFKKTIDGSIQYIRFDNFINEEDFNPEVLRLYKLGTPYVVGTNCSFNIILDPELYNKLELKFNMIGKK